MQTLSFERGVKQVVDMLRASSETPKKATAFLGAGVSIAAGIPSAHGLIKKVRDTYSAKFDGLASADQRHYGKVMHALAPAERRKLIRDIIDGARMNWANIALAQLIARGYFSRILTVNFDPLLAEACRLVGCSPAIYDFGVAPVTNVTAMATPAIVHLHGQSTGVVLLNTQEETDKHAERVMPLLNHCVPHAPLVVAGYSGEADALLAHMSNCCAGEHDIYWLDVSDEPPPHVARAFENKNYVHYVAKGYADRFFVEVAQRLDCFPPKFIGDPLGHLLSEGQRIVEFPHGSTSETQDLLAVWRSDIGELQQIDRDRFSTRRQAINLSMAGDDKAAAQAAHVGPADSQLAEIVDESRYWQLIRKGNAALQEASTASGSKRDAKFKTAAAACRQALQIHPKGYEALFNWGNTMAEMANHAVDTATKYRLYDEASKKYAAALAIKPDAQDMQDALINWGLTLSAIAECTFDAATKDRLYSEACEKYAAALAIKPDEHEALSNWGVTLAKMAECAVDAATKGRFYDEACEKYAAALAIKPDKHEALFNWGATLSYMAGRALDAATKDRLDGEACEKYTAALAIKPDNHDALNNWGTALGRMAERTLDAATKDHLYGEACEKFREALAIKPDMHDALYNWGTTLFHKASGTESEATRSQILRDAESKFRAAEAISEGVASYNLACLFSVSDRPDECREFLTKAHKSKRPPDRHKLETDPDLAKVRALPWWPEILALAK